MRSPLTETYQRINALVDQVNALNEDERGLFLDLLLPESDEPVKQKKTRKKRATATPAAKKKGLPQQNDLIPDGAKPVLCGACGNDKDYQDHFAPSPNYHEFDKGKKAAASGD